MNSSYKFSMYQWDGETQTSVSAELAKDEWEENFKYNVKLVDHKTPEGQVYLGGKVVKEYQGVLAGDWNEVFSNFKKDYLDPAIKQTKSLEAPSG